MANFLFMGGPPPACMNSADANDDDIVDQTDVNFLLAYCSTGGSPPLAPGPFQCGEDPTPGALPCGNYSASACCAGCINQLPSDCNQDGVVDISDAVCLLGNLFLGTPALLPCGDGLSADPSNILLLDANGDSLLDISDGVYVLNFLFIGGPPPLSGSTCLYIQGCPQNSVCPECTL
ncbi:MAG: hypothetical protein O7J95_06410 [Planctomycetota bacterium]|nr:hypothetical protein [Planctomycetota bacterium]